MYEPYVRKKILYDCLQLLSTIIRPAFSGNCNTLINEIDFKYANQVLEKRTNKGISLKDFFNQNEVELLEHYHSLRTKSQEGALIKGYWKPLDNFDGSAPGSQEGSALCFDNNKLYLFGGFSRDVYQDMRV